MNRSAGFAIILLTCAAGARAEEVPPKSVVEQRVAAVARHDLDAIVALYAPDSVQTSPGFCSDRTGPEGARRTYDELFKVLPGVTSDVTTYVVDGDRVAIQFFARVRKSDGTIAFEMPIANFLTVEHGLITRDETYFDPKGRPCT